MIWFYRFYTSYAMLLSYVATYIKETLKFSMRIMSYPIDPTHSLSCDMLLLMWYIQVSVTMLIAFWRKQKFNRGTVSGSKLCKSKAFVTSISTQNKRKNNDSILLWNIASSIKSIMTSQEVRNFAIFIIKMCCQWHMHKSSIVSSILQ